MCYVIITCCSLSWTLLTLVSVLTLFAAIVTPQWLIGQPRQIRHSAVYNGTQESGVYYPTIGVYNRCTKLHHFGDFQNDNCATYVDRFLQSDDEFPHVWKATLLLFMLAGVLLAWSVLASIISLCVRSCCKKSIFTVTGLIQSIAGLFLIIALVLYPFGWGSKRVRNLCGVQSGPFIIDGCTIGWAFYAGIAGTVLVFVCAVLSIQAENTTSSDKVESEIMRGKNPVCII